MPRPKKLYKIIGRDVKIPIPQPPTHATHVWLQCSKTRKAIVPIKDFDTLWGVDGHFHFVRCDNKLNIKEKYKGKWFWTGRAVKGIEKLLDD